MYDIYNIVMSDSIHLSGYIIMHNYACNIYNYIYIHLSIYLS